MKHTRQRAYREFGRQPQESLPKYHTKEGLALQHCGVVQPETSKILAFGVLSAMDRLNVELSLGGWTQCYAWRNPTQNRTIIQLLLTRRPV